MRRSRRGRASYLWSQLVGKPEAFRKGCGAAEEAEPHISGPSWSESRRLSARDAAEPKRRSLKFFQALAGKPEAFRKGCGAAEEAEPQILSGIGRKAGGFPQGMRRSRRGVASNSFRHWSESRRLSARDAAEPLVSKLTQSSCVIGVIWGYTVTLCFDDYASLCLCRKILQEGKCEYQWNQELIT